MAREVVLRMVSGQVHYVRDMDEVTRSNLIAALDDGSRFVYIEVNDAGVRHGRLLNIARIESVDL